MGCVPSINGNNIRGDLLGLRFRRERMFVPWWGRQGEDWYGMSPGWDTEETIDIVCHVVERNKLEQSHLVRKRLHSHIEDLLGHHY